MGETRWFVVSDDPESGSAGFVDGETPLEAITAWVGSKYDNSAIFVVPAKHVRRFAPEDNPDTLWLEQPVEVS